MAQSLTRLSALFLVCTIGTTACWEIEGLGPGPYSASPSAEACVDRGLPGAMIVGTGEGEDAVLFCTAACPDAQAAGCPEADFIADNYADALEVTCVPSGAVQICALAAIDQCPTDMMSVDSVSGTLCYFAADS